MKLPAFHTYCIIAAIVYYGLVAWFATGYYHADEHFQIIEFAGVKAGFSQTSDLAWEYDAAIRPALQPTIAYCLLLVFDRFTQNPFVQSFLLRFLTGFLALFAICRFIKATLSKIRPKYHKAYFIVSYFLWFIPFIFTRFSSESWSAICLILAMALVLSKSKFKPKDAYALGLFLGFAFLFRYQTALVSMGILAWLFFIGKYRIATLAKSLIAIFSVISIGIIIDYWFYDELIITAWNYFEFNILMDGASQFGTKPLLWYPYAIIKHGFLPIGILIGLAFLYLLVEKPRSLFIWAIVPLFVAHSLIPHKEIRFLFPLAFLVAPVLFIVIGQFSKNLKTYFPYFKRLLFGLASVFLVILMACNIAGLLIITSKTAGARSMHTAQYIYDNYKDSKTTLYYLANASPYEPFGLPISFYTIDNVTSQEVGSLCDIKASSISEENTTLISFAVQDNADKSCLTENDRLKFTKLTQSWPKWLVKLNEFYTLYDIPEQAFLYKVELKAAN